MSDLFTNVENYRGKTPQGEFKVTTPENLLLLITSSYKYKESHQTLWPIPKYQPTIEPLPQYPIGLVLQRQSLHSMHEAKPYRVNLRSPLLRIHYYQSQAVTSIRNLTKPFGLSRNTNLQLNPYPNTQLDLYCSDNLSIQCTNPNT